MRVEVVVTAEDIALGVRFSPCECPVALALFRTTGHTWLVKRRTEAKRWQMEQTIALPWEAAVFIGDFDARRPVLPFCFVVKVPA